MQLSEPQTLKEYGEDALTVVCQNYMKGWRRGKSFSRGILLHGPPGIGKTTLVHVLSREYPEWQLIETNASLEFDREFLAMIEESIATLPLAGDHKIYFFDEVDSLTKGMQETLARIVRKARDPIFLACNDFQRIEDALRRVVTPMRMAPPSRYSLERVARANGLGEGDLSRAHSYRDVAALLDAGNTSILGRLEDDTVSRFKRVFSGELKPNVLHPSELDFFLCQWLADNVPGKKAGHVDRLLSMQRQGGNTFQKYILLELEGLKVADPKFPWSAMVPRTAPTRPQKASKRAEVVGVGGGAKGPKKNAPALVDVQSFF
jgi:hypothetical protein